MSKIQIPRFVRRWHAPWKKGQVEKRVENGTWFRKGKPTKLALQTYYLTQKELRKEKKRGGFIAKKQNAYSAVAKIVFDDVSAGPTIQMLHHQIDKFFSLKVV